jgi:hypothetical protein
MKNARLIKLAAAAVVLAIGSLGFLFARKSETQTLNPIKTPETMLIGAADIAGYKKWTKVNDKPYFEASRLSMLCTRPTKDQIAAKPNPHTDTLINVYVNAAGENEMLAKKNPNFPVGTVVVKEKFSGARTPELLTVMIKREKGFNPEVGDWEFMTLNGEATEVTARGKLENCQACHLNYEQTDFITRKYLPENIRQQLK